METQALQQKITMILDPYYDREFFTNLIYLWDRGVEPRMVMNAALREVNASPAWSDDLDRALAHLFYSYQAASAMRDNYHWLPIANALFGISIHRGNGQKVVRPISQTEVRSEACTLDDFRKLMRKETRRVEPKERAWTSLLFLLENRTTRSQAISILLKESLESNSMLHFSMLEKSLEVDLAGGWKSSSTILRKPFDRFWDVHPTQTFVRNGLIRAAGGSFKAGVQPVEWKSEWSEELWKRASTQSSESVWEFANQLGQSGATYEQLFYALNALRGRALFLMNSEQWLRFTESLIWADSILGAHRLCPTEDAAWLSVSIEELVETLSHLPVRDMKRPTGTQILDGASKNISKDRLIFRLDDAVERGDRNHSLELLAAVVQDGGLSRTLADRLLMMAAKQDSWTFQSRVLPVAMVLTQVFQNCQRLRMSGALSQDALFGLLRFLSDVRDMSLQIVSKTGTYGDGMKTSQYDVSGGARIVDRFVFNQLRNAQRIKVWPSDG